METKNINFTGTWIPKEVYQLGKMPGNERIILSIIINLENKERGCYASNKYFANILQLKQKQVTKIISALFNKGLISSEILIDEGNKRILRSLLETFDNPTPLQGDTYPVTGGYPTPLKGDTLTPTGGYPTPLKGDAYKKVDTEVYKKDEREALSHFDFFKNICKKEDYEKWKKDNEKKIYNLLEFIKAFNNDMQLEGQLKNEKLKFRIEKYTRSWISRQKDEDRPQPKPKYLENIL